MARLVSLALCYALLVAIGATLANAEAEQVQNILGAPMARIAEALNHVR